MRKSGVIIDFNRRTGWGTISTSLKDNEKFPFNISSIFDFQNLVIGKGQLVDFSVRTIYRKRIAVNIVLLKTNLPEQNLLEQEKLEEIIKYQYENWEEVEKLTDAKYESETISSASLGSIDIVNSNPQKTIDSSFIALALFDNKIKLVSLTKDGKFSFLDEGQKYHNIIYPSAFEEAALELAIEEFEYLINSPKASENNFQKFFERNPDFILNDDYKQAHPHVVLSREKEGELITDFVLEPVSQSSFCDLLELKLPSAKTYVLKKNREHFSAAITQAAAQLRVYANFFNEEKNRNNFQQIYPHLRIYKPRMFLIIGRESNANSMIKRDIQSEYPQLIINNFDDLLARMKWKKERLENKNKLFR